jgi:hypothetical protein
MMPQTLDRPVVQIHMGYLELSRTFYPAVIPLDCEAVVLRRDEDSSRFDFLDRVISSTMPVRHLHSRSTKGEAEELVPKADPKRGDSG